MSHTPGPWAVTEYPNLQAAREDGLFEWALPMDTLGDCFDGGPVGTVWQRGEDGSLSGLPGSIEVCLADAHLIAAAPDLLAALRLAVPILERLDTVRHLAPAFPELDAARAAIAKAEGK